VRTARARKEILVSSGAYNSPQLLQLSGVGPADLLSQHGIGIVLDAPGVGNDLQDHMQVRLVTRCAQKVTLNDVVNHPIRKMMAGLQYAAFRKGPLTSAAGTSGAFFKTSPRLASPDIQSHFLPFSTDKMEKLHAVGFTASVCQLRPKAVAAPHQSADHSVLLKCINYLATEPIARLYRPSICPNSQPARSLCGGRGRSSLKVKATTNCWNSAAAPAARSITLPRPAAWAATISRLSTSACAYAASKACAWSMRRLCLT
jgi:choline dehydrogenase-like flavoprotein